MDEEYLKEIPINELVHMLIESTKELTKEYKAKKKAVEQLQRIIVARSQKIGLGVNIEAPNAIHSR